jgi:hypothetical protein
MPSSVIQLALELVWLPVGFNRLCDLKATWRKVLGFQLLEKPNSQLSLELGSCYLRDRSGGVRDPGDAEQCYPR